MLFCFEKIMTAVVIERIITMQCFLPPGFVVFFFLLCLSLVFPSERHDPHYCFVAFSLSGPCYIYHLLFVKFVHVKIFLVAIYSLKFQIQDSRSADCWFSAILSYLQKSENWVYCYPLILRTKISPTSVL